MKKILRIFNVFDIVLWAVSVIAIITVFCISPSRDYFALGSALTGVTSLMFIVKGNVIGQFIMVFFAVLYGIVSYFFKYYGEMITYLGMSAPAAVLSIISWLRHPYKDHSQVKINRLNGKKIALVAAVAVVVTVSFYFILKACGTNNLIVSTVSVTTSVIAASFTYLRSPLYGLAYACNDIVLIVMWILATVADIAYLPMVICFSLFFIYDIYGFINWTAMRKNQNASPAELPTPTEEKNIQSDTIE